jgi:LmbE family N-acetylglucosaminyl deacetylase
VNILALGAHPDDIEYGCGGTFLKYARKGIDLYFMVLTKGEFGGDAETREKEQEEAPDFSRVYSGCDPVCEKSAVLRGLHIH